MKIGNGRNIQPVHRNEQQQRKNQIVGSKVIPTDFDGNIKIKIEFAFMWFIKGEDWEYTLHGIYRSSKRLCY